MAWADNLLDASFRGIVFDITDVEDAAERALAEHAYPYINGADIEDLGLGAKSISVQAIFFGDDYETRLQAFLAALDAPGAGELVHPVFGSFKSVQVRSRSVQHNAEGVDQATVAIQFVESTAAAPFFDRSLAAQKAESIGLAGDAARALSANALGGLVDTLRTLNPLKTFDGLRATLLGPILALQSSVSGVILAGLDAVAVPRAWAADLDALTGGVLDLLNPLLDPLASWRQAGNTLALLFPHASGGASAAPVIPAAPTAPSEAQARAVVGAHVAVALAAAQADAAAVVLAAEAEAATLSPQEIEAVANDARQALDAAIEAARSVWPLETSHALAESLKTTALAVQDAAQAVIAARPPLVTRSVASPGNLRLIAHRWYGDHTRAPELARLNNLRLPNFIQMGDALNAYAR